MKGVDHMKYVGKRVPRYDGLGHVTGKDEVRK